MAATKEKPELFGVPAEEGELFGVPADSQPVPGMPGGQPPNLPKAPLPNDLKPDSEQEQSFITSPHGLIRTGLRRALHGVEQAANPGLTPKLGGASEVIRGLGTAALPAAIPLAAANPITAVGGIAAGVPMQFGAEYGARALGASPEASALTGDVAGIGAGIFGGGIGSKIQGLVSAIKNGGRQAQDAALQLIPYFGGKASKLRSVIDPPYQPSAPFAVKSRIMGLLNRGAASPEPGEGLQAGTILTRANMRPPAPEAEPTAPFRPNSRVKAMLGRGKGTLEGEETGAASASRMGTSGPRMMPGAAGSKRVEVQHLGDMRLPRNQPKLIPGPKMYDSAGRLIRH